MFMPNRRQSLGRRGALGSAAPAVARPKLLGSLCERIGTPTCLGVGPHGNPSGLHALQLLLDDGRDRHGEAS